MFSATFRPWGTLDWIMPHFLGDKVAYIGVVATEARSLAVIKSYSAPLAACHAYRIHDPLPREQENLTKLLDARKEEFQDARAGAVVRDIKLLASLPDIFQVLDNATIDADTILVDISSMPKRFFFPIIKRLLSSERYAKLRNIIVSYTVPEKYAEGSLAENPDAWDTIPSFNTIGFDDAKTRYDYAFIGVGFTPLRLTELFSKQDIGNIKAIFPFPPGPPTYNRNWMFMEEIEQTLNVSLDDPVRVDVENVSEVFDAIRELTSFGDRSALLAPFGPKTFSLAMCLYSIASELTGKGRVPVFYSQPRTYDINYSSGVKKILGYAIRVDGRNLYEMRDAD